MIRINTKDIINILNVPFGESNHTNFTVADIEKDGIPEIIFETSFQGNPGNLQNKLVCYDTNGTTKWISDQSFVYYGMINNYGTPALVDFNKDGTAEVYEFNEIFNALTGIKLMDGGNNVMDGGINGDGVYDWNHSVTIAAQLDGDTTDLELAAGYTIYKVDINNTSGTVGNTMTANNIQVNNKYLDGYTSVADINLDGTLDVVVISPVWSSDAIIYIYTMSTGSLSLLAKSSFPGFSSQRIAIVPAIGDIDGNGTPSIVFCINKYLYCYKYDGTDSLKKSWTIPTAQGHTNYSTEVHMFDFNGDGINEIIYNDNDSLKILSGVTNPPTLISKIHCPKDFPRTPIRIADMYNSGHANICTVCGEAGEEKLTVFGAPDSLPGWAPARNMWNQYNYHGLNINDDLTVPRYMKNNATYKNGKYNNFFVQQALSDDGTYLMEAASLYGEIKCINYDTASHEYEVIFDVINSSRASKEAETNIPISFYDDDPGTTGNLLGTFYTNNTILPGDTLHDLSIRLYAGGISKIVMAINTEKNNPGAFNAADFNIVECDYTDNFYFTAEIPKIDSLDASICEGQSYDFHGTILSNEGRYFFMEQNMVGCDSLIEMLNLMKTDTVEVHYSITSCDEYFWHDSTLTATGTYLHTETNVNGCDSLEFLDLSIHNSYYDQIQQTSCDSFAWNGNTYDETGIYQYEDKTIAGCDSIITLDLTINKTDKLAITETACDSFYWNGTNYMQSGSYVYQSTNVAGCDSIMTLELTVNDHIEQADTLRLCAGDSILIFGNWVKEAGVITEIFTSSTGCDSIRTYHIEITALPEGQLEEILCSGDSIFIVDRWFIQGGEYTLRKANANACDSLIELTITEILPKIAFDTISLCRGDTIVIFGTEVMDEMDLTADYISSEGCDSIVNMHVFVKEPVNTEHELSLCPGDSIFIGGMWINADSQAEEIFQASNGCDSTSLTNIRVIEEPEEPEMEPDCETREIALRIEASEDWKILWDNGSTNKQTIYENTTEAMVLLDAIEGCQRQFTIQLPEIPDFTLIKQPKDTTINRAETLKIDLGLDLSEWEIIWTPTESVDCDSCSLVHISVAKNTDFTIYLKHESGCEYEIVFRVNVEKTKLFIPNVFTPNGDGLNDNWKVAVSPGFEIEYCSIYDSWGEKIYSKSGEIDWDGTFKGVIALPGVYVYIIKYLDENGKLNKIAGDVTLLR